MMLATKAFSTVIRKAINRYPLFFLIFCLLPFTVALVSCEKKEQKIEQELQEISKSLHDFFSGAKERVEHTDRFTEGLLKRDLGKISIADMDQTYSYYGTKTSNFKSYYKLKKNGSGLVYTTGFFPINEQFKKRMKLMEELFPLLKKNTEGSDYMAASWYVRTDGLVVGYPYVNLVSVLSPGLDFSNMHWFVYTNKANNPEKVSRFIQEPFVDLGGFGLVIPVNSPVYDSNGVWTGNISIDIQMDKVAKKFIQKNPHPILLTSSETTLIGISPSAQKRFRLNTFGREMWLKQGEKNVFLDEKLKLSRNESEEIRFLAKQIKSTKNRFEIRIDGKKYIVLKKKIPLVNFYLLGIVD